MGTGFVCALSPEDAVSLADETDGRVVGHVEACDEGEAGVSIRGLDL
jgi:phosphoribosylformylglycinamidine cyclo-ligase